MVVINHLINKNCGVPVVKALKLCPKLSTFLISPTQLDLGNPEALLIYNQLILREFLGLEFSVPKGYLIPTICSRWEFIKFILEDFAIPPQYLIEIGTGASAILAMMLGFLGLNVKATEVNGEAYKSAMANIKQNKLTEKIELIKSDGEIVNKLFRTLNSIDAIICNPPQYDEKYYYDHYQSPRGFKGEYSELVGGEFGHEFIMSLISEINEFPNPPPIYFQLTLPKLRTKLEEDLKKQKYNFLVIQKKIGTRLRLYYRVNLVNSSDT